ncbi:hypothetical protein [Dyella subtropica]|uniref:hypothetical protein n=1 Tax=Dyella subtropica TaxID=2992127 RepID=UPI0022549D10|nr:hypothetical protein [Dyella subtropica]
MAKSDSLQLRDMRPSAEKEGKIFSLLITSKEYGILRAGDAKLSPPPVRLLQHEAFEKFAAMDHQPQVTVYHFVIYENMRSQLRSGALGAGVGGVLGGLIGNAMASHDASSQTSIVDERTFSSTSDEYLRGMYTSTENPDKASVYIIYIDTDIDGKKVFTRTVASMKPHGDQNPFADGVRLAIKNHLSRYEVGAMATAATASVAPTAPTVTSAAPATTADASTQASQTAPTDGATMSMAQSVANQLRCGAVRADGNSIFVASCGSYDVAIDCGDGSCHPTHTVSTKGNQ